MKETALKLLEVIGFEAVGTDPLIEYLTGSVTEKILNATNQMVIPEGLKFVAAEMVVGEYLNLQKNSGKLTSIDLEPAVKAIQEGDTNITFALGGGSTTPEQRLDALIDHLSNGHRAELLRYRRLVW